MIGVVLAGILASFVITGPFDWGSTLIGLVLLAVLVGYAHWPEGGFREAWRPAVGLSAASAFVWVQILGRPLDSQLELSGWADRKGDELQGAEANPDGGLELLILWSSLAVLAFLLWCLVEWLRRRRPTDRKPTR